MVTIESIKSANSRHARITRLLDELRDERGRAFAVAAAGYSYIGERDINVRGLFDVIQEIEGDAGTEHEIRRELDALAKLAGSSWKPKDDEVSHA
jgi:hypothetical protein